VVLVVGLTHGSCIAMISVFSCCPWASASFARLPPVFQLVIVKIITTRGLSLPVPLVGFVIVIGNRLGG
jgi:hypothetical protein